MGVEGQGSWQGRVTTHLDYLTLAGKADIQESTDQLMPKEEEEQHYKRAEKSKVLLADIRKAS